MGGLFKSGTKTTKSETAPWKPQQGYLKHGFDEAKKALSQSQEAWKNIGAFPGMNSTQTGALAGLSQLGNQFSQGMGGILGTAMQGASHGAMTAYNPALSQMQNNANWMASQATGPNQGMQYADQNRQFFQNGPTQAQTGQVAADVSADKTGQVVSNAGQYAANPYLDGQVDAALRDVNRAFQQERGEINAAAVGAGAVNSTRAGVLDARAQTAAMDRAADIASQMRGQAWEQGINTASQMEQHRQQAALAANQQRQTDDAYIQRGMLDSTGQFINAQGQNFESFLQANQQLGQAAGLTEAAMNGAQQRFNQSLDAVAKAYGLSNQGLLDALASGDRTQKQAIDELAFEMQKAGIPLELVNQYMASIGGSYGGTSRQQTPTSSPFQQLVGGAASLMGGYGAMS